MLDVIDVYLRWIIWNVFIMKVYKQMDIPGNKKGHIKIMYIFIVHDLLFVTR